MESSASFPSPVESTVASALLLLSSSTSPPSPPCSAKQSKSHVDHDSGSLFEPISKSRASSSTSTMTGDDGSSPEETRGGGGRLLRLVSVFAGYHDMQFKVVRKSRSKTLWISDCQKNTSSKVPMSPSSETVSETTEASSCLTTGSVYSSVTSGSGGGGSSTTATARPRRSGEVNVARGGLKKERVYYSANLSRRAQAILKLLSNGCCLSEIKIRELLGDSPDTSKALRMLLRKEQVRRSGAGGRADPFIYKKA